MVELLVGGAYGLMLVIAFFIGERIGKDIGRESCAESAGKMIGSCCCEECMKRIHEYAKRFGA